MVIDMIRRKRLVSSIMAGIMSGLLVVGNIGAFPDRIVAQEGTALQTKNIYTAVKDINNDENNYKPLDVSDPIVRFLRNGDEGETVILRLIGFSHLILGIYWFER